MEQLQVTLTKEQDQCVTFKPKGDLLVQGIPGSGKSTILLARAQYLLKKYPNDTVLFLTFSRTLTNYIKQLADKLDLTNVEAKTFHQWGKELIESTSYPNTKLKLGKDRDVIIRYAKNIINKQNKDASFPSLGDNAKSDRHLIKFLGDEFEWIKGTGINMRNNYLNIKRSGRGRDVRVNKTHRETIYDVLEKYNELLGGHFKHRGIDSDDLSRLLIENHKEVSNSLLSDHILVDEAQDFHTLQLKAISTFAKKSLTIGADKGQQIYRRNFTWKSAGIDVKGGRSKYLKKTFRSTRQIITLANDFQEKDPLLVKDADYQKPSVPDIDGKLPELVYCDKKADEEKIVLKQVQKIRTSFPEHTIGVIATTHKRLDDYKSLLEAHGVPVYKIKDEDADIVSPGVKLITYHSSKGLEFDHVLVTELKQGKLPYKQPAPGDDEEEFMSRERKKLYVAMTRAKKTLFLIATRTYSSFIKEFNEKYYKVSVD
ncbi:ATP-dependent helicase [Halobacillus kuroshimensis]|uniref:DNA 3'-5' helicase n=1 Tax=Halobacillus kuroshimensis TaxID=302481 RepID=A0ABS3DYJ1_9BACI|nr:3'-5' exonuclease [Halobacillus kuroshimensis]MBN8236422.1 ATP-dependent helicase [Halobacillus kuroshimensis]